MMYVSVEIVRSADKSEMGYDDDTNNSVPLICMDNGRFYKIASQKLQLR